jgi:hypothetical protein
MVVSFLPFSQGAIVGDTQNSKTTLKVDNDVSQVSAAYKKKYKSYSKKKYYKYKKTSYYKKYKYKKYKKHYYKKSKSSSPTHPATAEEKEELNHLQGTAGLNTLEKYINKHLNHRSGAAHTAEGVEKTGYGDCWGLSDWTAKKLSKNGYQVKVVQGATSASSRHRWTQVKVDGKWTTFEPSLVTKKYGSKHYTATCGKVSSVISAYNC